jgi:hypothetical protein
MPGLRQLRAFSVEMMKLAADVQDAGIRDLLAFRRGEEYLPGGQLESNTEEEVRHQSKLGAYGTQFGESTGRYLGLASDSFDHRSRTKKHNNYQKGRDYTTTGLKGGLTGLGVLGAINTMRGRFGSPAGVYETRKAMNTARKAFGIGASAAVADRAYRHDELPKTASDIGALGVQSTPGNLKSPGAQLSQARATGLFRNVNHASEGLKPRSLQMGTKFRVA